MLRDAKARVNTARGYGKTNYLKVYPRLVNNYVQTARQFAA